MFAFFRNLLAPKRASDASQDRLADVLLEVHNRGDADWLESFEQTRLQLFAQQACLQTGSAMLNDCLTEELVQRLIRDAEQLLEETTQPTTPEE